MAVVPVQNSVKSIKFWRKAKTISQGFVVKYNDKAKFA